MLNLSKYTDVEIAQALLALGVARLEAIVGIMGVSMSTAVKAQLTAAWIATPSMAGALVERMIAEALRKPRK